MANDDNSMGGKEIAGGLATGAGVAYGASALRTGAIKDVKFVDLIVPPAKAAVKATQAINEGEAALFEKYGVKAEHRAISVKRLLPKLAEQLGLDVHKFSAPLKELANNPESEEAQKALGVAFQDAFKAAHKKAPSVNEMVKFSDSASKLYPETLAETVAIPADKRAQFVSEYLALGKKEIKPLFAEAEKSARRFVGAVKYEKAAWYQKPLVAFEAMSTKGKVAVGAIAAASSLGAAYMINHMRSGKSSDSAER
jgi:hypothetical protein